MKTVLKFLTIFFSSLILAGIFGYWFGRFNELLLVNIFGFYPGFSTFLFSEQSGLFIDGLILAIPFFATSFSWLVFQTKKSRLISTTLAGLPSVLIVASKQIQEFLMSILMILFGYFFGLLILSIKRLLLAKNK